jgi:hypothetical protein
MADHGEGATALLHHTGDQVVAVEKAHDPLAADLDSSAFKLGVEREFWRLVRREGNRVYVECFAWNGDNYVLEVNCDQYIIEPCLGRFVNPETGKCDATDWPQGTDTFYGWFKWKPGELFVCWPGDRAGIAHHPNWRALEHWRKTKNPLVQYLEFIRECLTIRARGYLPRTSLPQVS